MKSSSQINLTKYKFIPPSKLLKAQKNSKQITPIHTQSVTQFTIQDNNYSKQSNQLNRNFNKSKSYAQFKSNQNRLNSSALRSSEKPNYKNLLKQKQQQQEKKAQLDINDKIVITKLQKYIKQLKDKQQNIQRQLKILKQENIYLHQQNYKLEKQLENTHKKYYQLKNKYKSIQKNYPCQEHQLIIKSLKKIIQNQLLKIQMLEREVKENCLKSDREYEQCNYSHSNNKQNIFGDQPSKKLENSRINKIINNGCNNISDNPSNNGIKFNITAITPDFGPSTPNDTIKQALQKQEQDQNEIQMVYQQGEKLLKQIDKYLFQWKNK